MVVGIAIASGYLNSRLDKFVDWGLWTALVPLLISLTNVGISMLSTRFTGKLSKWGNYFALLIPFCPVLLIISLEIRRPSLPIRHLPHLYLCYKEMESFARRQTQPNEPKTGKIGGHHHFHHRLPLCLCNQLYRIWGKMNLLAYVTTIAFALSLIANALNALKLTTQWGFWLIYNFVQLTKAGIQGNFANIGKYIFYILNAIGALFVWNDEEVRYIEGNSNKEY